MDRERSNSRSDERLEAILCETSNWAVKGSHGRVLGFAASLGRALQRSLEYSRSGATVTTICRLPLDNIVIFPAQIERLRKAARVTPVPVAAK
jgi:hypothetical protein